MNWPIVLPILAITLTIIVIVLLWYWWSSSREEQALGDPTAINSSSSENQPAQGWMRAIGLEMRLVYRLRDWVRANFPGLIRSTSSLISGRSGIAPVRQTGELVEAIRLFRDLATGGLVVEVGSRRYSALSEMTDDTIRRRFLGIAESMAHFAAGAVPPPPANIPTAVVTPPVYAPPPAVPASAAPISTTTDAKKADKAAPVVLKSVAEEIEELLQYRLTITPEFSQRSIHIRESHGGAIQVEVDGHYYDGVGEVSDESVKTFLQDIVREWEARK